MAAPTPRHLESQNCKLQAGMDMGIVNAGALPLYSEIETELLNLCEDLLWNRDPEATEKMLVLAQQLKKGDRKVEGDADKWRSEPLEQRMAHALLRQCQGCFWV